jgi:biopolymer transport protein ExbD
VIFRRRPRRPEDPAFETGNMTPMIDCVFQLLIFFMLSMHFKEVEGKLLSQLPQKGPGPGIVPPPVIPEVRVVICAGGDILTHLTDKGRHEKADKPNESCHVAVDRNPVGEVHRTDRNPDRAAANRSVYRAAGVLARDLHARSPVDERGRPVPVIVDADSEVPYEHVIGAVNALKEAGIHNVEFVANPRHEKYYGSFQKGPFDRGRK